MGLLGKLFNRGGVDKNSLIRDLVRLRVRNDPMADAMGFREEMADSLSRLQLAGIPEGTIVAIVETWSILKKRGMEDSEIFLKIENHRSRLFPGGRIPIPTDLLSYIKYRIEIEQPVGAPISHQFIVEAVDIAKEAYGT